jgi:lysyl-tRNA synthetase class 2
MSDWQPTASLEILKIKARLLSKLRAFFAEKDVLEVHTPILSHAGNTEPAFESFFTAQNDQSCFLNTSPEFAMKRLLAAGCGSIYQISPAFRQGEQGKKHNPEFTLLEWYRVDFDHLALMEEVDALLRFVAEDVLTLDPSQFFSYRQAMIKFAEVDPFIATKRELKDASIKAGIDAVGMDDATTDEWLDLLMSLVVEKNLPLNCPVFIYDYPASQAALAKITKGSPAVAERFELYINRMELANGFHELSDAEEQETRFKKQQVHRNKTGQAYIPIDYHLISALKQGLPECAGVAIGLDRLLMVLTAAEHINEVLTFPFERA